MAPFYRRKTIHEERTKRRIHTIVPWIQNPLQGVDKQHLVFAPRHEASTLELFFDLFFVANLATFTAYHYIIDHSSLFAYIGFFTIIWVTWFHTVLHDVRFENDSIYSRACKVVIMVVFVGFALVGSSFAPGTAKGDNTNFRTLCYTLVMSRVLFSIKYLVVGVFVVRARRADLYLPVFLNALVYIVATAAYGAMTPAFAELKPVETSNGIYSVWWIIMAVESVATIGVSCIWRMMSFKKTHLVERMGLLTLIVIGEGAIGVTKTISRMMGKSGIEPEGSALIFCIVLMLIGTWMLYFDNQPHGHFGTIKQQIWSAMHFPIHLAIVGLVEGAQQVALARYISTGILKFEKSLVQYCFTEHLDGAAMTTKLNAAVKYLQLEKKAASLLFVNQIHSAVDVIGATPGICGPGVTGTSGMDLPLPLIQLYANVLAGMYSALGLSMPTDQNILLIMIESWKLVYRYFWSAFLILIGCFLIGIILVRTTKLDAFHHTALLGRAVAVVAAAVLLGLSANKDLMYAIMETPAILPVAVVLLYLIIVFDRFGGWVANKRNRKSGDPLTGAEQGHGHGHAHDDGHQHGHGHGHKESLDDGHPHSAADKQSLIVSECSVPAAPLHAEPEEYNGAAYGMPSYAGDMPMPNYQPPQPTPAVVGGPGHPPVMAYNPGGYAPVQNGHYGGQGY